MFVEFGRQLLGDGVAHKIGFAKLVAEERAGDFHDLFLIDDNAVGFAKDRLQLGVQGLDLFVAVHAVTILF